MFIKPAEGRAARHPGTLRLLAAEGEHVQSSPFWLRLLATGDVVEAAAPETRPAVLLETTPTEQAHAAEDEQTPPDTSAAITETSTTVDTGEIR